MKKTMTTTIKREPIRNGFPVPQPLMFKADEVAKHKVLIPKISKP